MSGLVGISWLLGLVVPYPVTAATNSQVAARVTPQLADLVAALATGSVGAVALARSGYLRYLARRGHRYLAGAAAGRRRADPSVRRPPTSPWLRSCCSPPMSLPSWPAASWSWPSTGSSRVSGQAAARAFHYRGAVAVIAALLVVVIVPLWISSDRIYQTTVRQSDVQAVAEHWASDAGWSVVGVTAAGGQVLVEATGPQPRPQPRCVPP